MRLTIGLILTSQTLEVALRAGLPVGGGPASFPGAARHDGLLVDLSRVWIVDYVAAAQVLLLVDAVCRAGGSVRVDLPDPLMSDLEQIMTERPAGARDARARVLRAVANAARRRNSALTFLRSIGFVTAIRMPHLPGANVRVTGGQGDETDRDARVLPFRWIAPAVDETLANSSAVTATVGGLKDLGFPPSAARVLVYELVENVAAHAPDGLARPAPHALVGGLAVRSGTLGWQMLGERFPELVRSAADASLPVLRLVVGDSGVGLANHLGPYLPWTEWSDIPTPSGPPLTDSELTTIWSLQRWSTSDPSRAAARRRGTGLWWARRAIGQCGGEMLVGSADAFVGLALGSRSAELLRIAQRTRNVGTVVDIAALPQGSRQRRSTTGNGSDQQRFHWMRVAVDGESTDALRQSAHRLLDGEHGDPGFGLILTLDGGSAQPVSTRFLTAILAESAGLSSRCLVAVLVASVAPRALQLAVDLFHRLTGDDSPAHPFLIIDQRGHSRWCGGRADLRELLNSATEDPDGSVLIEGKTAALLSEALRDHPRLFSLHAGEIKLAITPTEVVAVLRGLVAKRLRTEVDSAGPGVSRGWFRTPTLQVTDRWVDVDALLREAVGMATAAFLLASQLVDNREAMPAGTPVLRVATASSELAEAVARSAGISTNAEVIIDEFDSSSEQLQQIKPGIEVVLCADLILTENSVRRAIAESLNWGAAPVAIVAPLDARDNDAPLDLLDTTVPVWNLTRIAVSSEDSAATPVDIDPVLRSIASVQSPLDPHYRLDPEEFLNACAAHPHTMSLGHVGRPAHRHFTICLDIGPLLTEDSGLRDRLVYVMVDAALEWLSAFEAPNGSRPSRRVVVCHPDHTDEHAGRLATLVAHGLEARLPSRATVETCPVPRAVVGSRWAFPQSLEPFRQDSDVVLVDWGSVDAITMTQLIRLTAEAGASRILALGLISQLQVHDERVLTMLRSVEGVRAIPGAERRPVEVPVRVRFLTALGISAMPLSKCPLCQLINQLRQDLEDGRLPAMVREHVEELAGSLRVRGRKEVVSEPSDAFGAPITCHDVAAYVRLRIRLLSAIRFTAERQRIADEFAALAADHDEVIGHAVIRLLAAERHWLKLAPLRFAECREAVARIGLEVAVDHDVDDRLRLQALIVLVSAAPEVFVRQLPTLWSSCLSRPLLVRQLLYQLSRILRRRRGDAPVAPRQLRDRISRCHELVVQQGPGPENDELEWQLARMALQVNDGQPEGEIRVREAWRALREQYLYRLRQHSDAESAMTKLRMQLDDLAFRNRIDNQGWDLVRSSWIKVQKFLSDYLLQYLPPLAGVLSGAFAEEHFKSDELRCVECLSSAESSERYLTALDARLLELKKVPARGDEVMLAELAKKFEILHRTVLATGAGDGMARLAHFIDACPTLLQKILRDCAAEPKIRRLPLHAQLVRARKDDIAVFCPKELLDNVVIHILENAGGAKHRMPGHEADIVELEISVSIDDREVRVAFRNDGTVPTAATGRGIASMRRKLRDFDGTLSPLATVGRWTYGIELRLPLWAAQPWKE
jgi:hypothetical protein